MPPQPLLPLQDPSFWTVGVILALTILVGTTLGAVARAHSVFVATLVLFAIWIAIGWTSEWGVTRLLIWIVVSTITLQGSYLLGAVVFVSRPAKPDPDRRKRSD